MKNNQHDRIEINEILEVLPHRQPFVFIDRVIESEKNTTKSRVGQRVKAIKNVTYGEPFFQGHFPHRPVMPGVLILEALAQASGIACHKPDDPHMDTAIGRLGPSRFRRPVVPGDQLVLEAEVVKDRGEMVVINCKASVDGQPVTEVEVLAFITPRKS